MLPLLAAVDEDAFVVASGGMKGISENGHAVKSFLGHERTVFLARQITAAFGSQRFDVLEIAESRFLQNKANGEKTAVKMLFSSDLQIMR